MPRPVARLALVLVFALAACAAPHTGTPPRSAPGGAHPLLGRVWDVGAARFVDEAAVVARLVASEFALLGEKHDNPEHHALQARLVRAIYASGRRPALALEMLTPAQGAAARRHLAARPRDVDGLGAAVGWERSGWPPWPLYAPIVAAAAEVDAAVVAANLEHAAVRAVVRDAGALDPTLARRFALDRPLADPAQQQALVREIREAHCDRLPESLVPGMALAQRARDAAMAAAMLDGGNQGTILIAGNGHVRSDRGVPALVRAAAPTMRLTALALLEVAKDAVTPGAYAEGFDGTLPFDYVWFTSRVEGEDPCDALPPRPG